MQKSVVNTYSTDETTRLEIDAPDIEIEFPRFYGQCGEDYLVLSLLRALATRESLDLQTERYCEVGAYHAVAGSATYLLQTGLGMSGVLVEANPEALDQLSRARPYDRVVNLAVTSQQTAEADLYIAAHGELTSTVEGFATDFDAVESGVETKIKVPATTLSSLIADQFPDRAPLFLSIDIEGADAAVLDSYDFAARPYVIQIEASEDAARDTFHRIEATLRRQGYCIVARTDVNQIAIDASRMDPSDFLASMPVGQEGMDKLLSSVKVLTLDVFDTILARRCAQPSDVFHWIENKLGVTGFAAARVAAEQQARDSHRERGSEVSLDEIYQQLPNTLPALSDLSFTLAQLMEEEIAAEKRFLYANPTIVSLINRARFLGLRVIAITDIYLSSSQVKDLLGSAGVSVDKIYASSDFRHEDLGKYNQKIFPRFLAQEKLSASEVLHVGDNEVSDVENASISGLCALHSSQINDVSRSKSVEIGEIWEYRSNTAGSIVLGQTTQWLAQSRRRPRAVEKYAYTYGGALLTGFLLYVVDQARKKGIRRLLLLERDGHIIKSALEILGVEDVEFRTVRASRRMTVFPKAAQGGYDAVASLFAGHDEMSEREFFEFLALPFPQDVAPDGTAGFSPQEIFERHESFLRGCAEQEKRLILEDLKDEVALLEKGEKLAWIDVGWALSSVDGLNTIIGHSVECFCIGSHKKVKPVQHSGYLFESGAPEEVSKSIMAAVEPIELIFSSTAHSTAYLEEGPDRPQSVHFPKSGPEIVRDAYITDVWAGALAFVSDIVDLVEGIDEDALREFNRSAFTKLCSQPHAEQYEALAGIPHDRAAGNGAWQHIRDFWKASPKQSVFVSETTLRMLDALQTGSQNTSKSGFRSLRNSLAISILNALSRCSPPLPRKMADRFSRSATKRELRR